MAAKVVLSLGSNLGNREQNLQRARLAIERNKEMSIRRISPIVESPAMGFDQPQPDFLNQVLVIESDVGMEESYSFFQQMEKALGRNRIPGTLQSRTMDIDIIFWDDRVVETEKLSIPHPRFRARRFVLEPLAAVAPDMIDPLTGETVHQLLEKCPDTIPVITRESSEDLLC